MVPEAEPFRVEGQEPAASDRAKVVSVAAYASFRASARQRDEFNWSVARGSLEPNGARS